MGDSLHVLARRIGGTDKGTVHSYLDTYGELFEPRSQSAKADLEIRILEGGSIAMWHEFFPNALVVGADIGIRPDAAARLDGLERVRLAVGDAYSDETAKKIRDLAPPEGFDVIIDDGPHTLESMRIFAARYGEMLAPGGVLVVEDVQSDTWIEDIVGALPESLRPHARTVDLRHIKHRYDDLMVVVSQEDAAHIE